MNILALEPAYAGQRAVLATKHGKLACVAPSLERAGLVVGAVAVDTDTLGTFTGEIPRTAPPLDTAVAKARLGMAATGNPIGVASEGSIGPHPMAPWGIFDCELVVLVDDRRGIVVAGIAASADITTISRTVRPGDDLEGLAIDADLPTHAVIVMPNVGPPHPVHKGLRHVAEIAAAVMVCAASSADAAAQVQTDLRAHVCPSRRRVIRDAAEDLAARLVTRCSSCRSPGVGKTGVVLGLPCRWCGADTDVVRAEIHTCPTCNHREERPVVPAGATADPGRCQQCNP